jgi:2-C-methyl-D-erythritol 2,4-cyclodiphosphate synthase
MNVKHIAGPVCLPMSLGSSDTYRPTAPGVRELTALSLQAQPVSGLGSSNPAQVDLEIHYSGAMAGEDSSRTLRIGHGYDLHRLEARPPAGAGRILILGGVGFPEHAMGPISHSDGDAVYHAVTDAILGAMGLPDIGQLFPDDDPRFESADSATFLSEAAARMASTGHVLANIDITVICERPKLSPHKPAMIGNIARLLQCDPGQVNLKGKTHEKVDAVGEGRAVEVHVVALLMRV